MSPFIVNYYEWKKKQLTNDKKVIKYTSNKWLKVQPSHRFKKTYFYLITCLSLVLNALFWIAKIYELWASTTQKKD